MAFATDCHAVGGDIFRQSHTHVTTVPDVVDVRSCHFAHKGNLADGRLVGTLLGGSDGGHGKDTFFVCLFNQSGGML